VTNLQAQLEEYKQASRQRLDAEKRRILEDHVRRLQMSGLLGSLVRVGSRAPNFNLPDHSGIPWDLVTALRSGPVVLKFYRGTWCPYCNIELRAYQLRLPKILQRGASFAAISPEKPDFAQSLLTREQIQFPVLHDRGNAVARQFGLEFMVDNRLQQLMKEFGHDLAEKNGDESWMLPVPGIFVISRSGVVEYSFADVDFTVRADPDEVLAALDKL
jgi:peroxiredoxin